MPQFACPPPQPLRWFALVMLAAGCSQPGEPSPKTTFEDVGEQYDVGATSDIGAAPAALFVEPATLALEAGRTATLAARILDSNDDEISGAVVWTSSSDAVAEVTPAGVVIGRMIGTATVSASFESLVGSADIRVTGAPVDRIEVSPTSRLMRVGDAVQINVSMYDAQNAPIDDPRDVVYASSQPSTIDVDGSGLVTAVAMGLATVTTTVEGHEASSEFTVAGDEPIDRVEVLPVTSNVVRGGSIQLTATGYVGGASVPNTVFQWTSAQPAIATVSGQGVVTGAARGTTQITATAGGVEDSATVNVTFAFTDLAVGHDFACGLVGGAAYCWGRNDVGQLGRADTTTVPGPVATSVVFDQLIAGAQHVCGLTSAGAAHCWGAGSSVPTAVGAGLAFTSLHGGFQTTCGVQGQSLWCWEPGVAPAVLGAYTQAAFGQSHVCALGGSGASCWGSNDSGQLGINVAGGTYGTPQPVSGGFTFAEFVAGRAHTCGTTTSGASLCWGANGYGQVGDGGGGDRVTPLLLAGGVSIARLTAGLDHTCGLAATGAAYCWGRNDGGELGTGSIGVVAAPTAVVTAVRFSKIAAGDRFTCALSVDGDPYCWGISDRGQLGLAGPALTPIPVSGL